MSALDLDPFMVNWSLIVSTRKLLDYKFNVIGTVLISIIASTTTLVLASVIENNFAAIKSSEVPVPVTAAAPNVIECDQGLYSPVQRACVSKEVFDSEMKRLFSALGIDSSSYDARRKEE